MANLPPFRFVGRLGTVVEFERRLGSALAQLRAIRFDRYRLEAAASAATPLLHADERADALGDGDFHPRDMGLVSAPR